MFSISLEVPQELLFHGVVSQEKATINKPLTAQDILISVESFCYFTTNKFTPMTSAFFPLDTNNNYWTSQSIIPGVRKSHLKLNFGAINVRTVCQIGSKSSLTLEFRSIDVNGISEILIKDTSVIIHLTSPSRYRGPMRLTLSRF